MLKRGLSSTVKVVMARVHRVARQPELILCERGIRTFETLTRNSWNSGFCR